MKRLAFTASLAVVAVLLGEGCADDPYEANRGGPRQGSGPDAGSPALPPAVHVISGLVSAAFDGGVDGYLVRLEGGIPPFPTTTTSASGLYSFTDILDGTYAVVASKPGYLCSPPITQVVVNGANVDVPSFLCDVRSSTFRGVWGSGADDVWVVGLGGLVLHWNGTAWSTVSSGTTEDLFGIWGSAGDDVWAAGTTGTLLHWNGSVWSLATSGTCGTLDLVWGSGPKDVWAGGLGELLHWDGTAWSNAGNVLLSALNASLTGIWGSGPDDVWVVGGGYSDQSEQGFAIRTHWNGAAWSTEANGTLPQFLSVWGSGHDDVWAGGLGSFWHWDGNAWSNASATTNLPLSMWGSGPNDVWAVGSRDTLLHWDGSAWSTMTTSAPQYLFSVWGSGPGDAWAVGEGRTIVHWDGSAWSSRGPVLPLAATSRGINPACDDP